MPRALCTLALLFAGARAQFNPAQFLQRHAARTARPAVVSAGGRTFPEDSFCATGLRVSINDRFVCCPAACNGCDLAQCQLKRSRCCPASIAKRKIQCLKPEDVGCVVKRDAVSLLHARAAAGRVGSFCRNGTRGVVGARATCCVAGCDTCSAVCPGPCCGREHTRPCAGPLDRACAGPRPELDVATFKGAPKDESRGPVHVVVAGDRVQALGILACANSVVESTGTPSRVRLHVVVDEDLESDIRDALECALPDTEATVYAFVPSEHAGKTQAGANLTFRAPTSQRKGNLAAGPNFARFYLAEMLPLAVQKVVYLDADVVLKKDVCHFYDTALTDATDASWAVAAVSRKYKPMCGSWLNCRSREVNQLLASRGLDEPAAQLDAFNAGVLALHLGRWRARNLTAQVEFWIRWNMDLPLYKLGSNPPLILSVRQDFQHLDLRWNCQRGHSCWDEGDAGALHWSGGVKPWSLSFARDRYDWLPHLPSAKCRAALPALGDVPEYAKRDPNARPFRAEAPRPQKGAPRPRRRDAKPTKGDRDLLWTAYEAVGRVEGDDPFADEAGTWDAKVRALRESVDEQAAEWPERPAAAYLAEARAALRAEAANGTCDAVLACVAGGRVFADASNYGGGPCGRAPGREVLEYLEFLAALLETRESWPDACFVLSAAASEVARGSVPFVARHKHPGRGVLAPGPQDLPRDDARKAPKERTIVLDEGHRGRGAKAAELVARWPRMVEALKAATDRPDLMPAMTAEAWRSGADEVRWAARLKKALWRGKLAPGFDCSDGGAWARVEAVAVSLLEPSLYDARFTHKLKLNSRTRRVCLDRAPLSPGVLRQLRRCLLINSGTARPVPFPLQANVKYRALLQAPAVGGCPDAADAVAWGSGAAVLRWPLGCAPWYQPALEHGLTHLDVNVRIAVAVGEILRDHDDAARYLARGARLLFDRVLCPDCVAEQWARVLAAFARRFGAGGFRAEDLVPFDPASPWKTFDPTLADEFKRAVGGP